MHQVRKFLMQLFSDLSEKMFFSALKISILCNRLKNFVFKFIFIIFKSLITTASYELVIYDSWSQSNRRSNWSFPTLWSANTKLFKMLIKRKTAQLQTSTKFFHQQINKRWLYTGAKF